MLIYLIKTIVFMGLRFSPVKMSVYDGKKPIQPLTFQKTNHNKRNFFDIDLAIINIIISSHATSWNWAN